MFGERHQAPVAPGLAGRLFPERELIAPFAMCFSDDGFRPRLGRLSLFDEFEEARAETGGIILQTARRVEIDGLEWADESPAPAQAFGDGFVDILRRRDAGFKQAKGLPQKRCLQTIGNEAVNLATDAKYAKVLEEYKVKLKQFQDDTQDPWVLKWRYE